LIREIDQDPSMDLAAAADLNLVVHAGWVQQRTPGMRVLGERGLVLVDSGLHCDTFNVVCHARLSKNDALDRVCGALNWFAALGRPFSWWVGPADQPPDLGEMLLAAGLERAETELAMAIELEAIRERDLRPHGLQIHRVVTPAQLDDFARISAANWTPPDPHVLRFYEMAQPVLLTRESPLWLYVGYLDGLPVATAELTLGGGVAGLYNISTLEAFRRRGFGTALALQPLLDARAQDYSTAILQAAADGVSVYRRVGFEPFGEITEYKPPSPAVRGPG
jgi:ribosomal protein S18 acetylase RimI-like enzyme